MPLAGNCDLLYRAPAASLLPAIVDLMTLIRNSGDKEDQVKSREEIADKVKKYLLPSMSKMSSLTSWNMSYTGEGHQEIV